MAAPEVIGESVKRDNGGGLSGDAYKSKAATANYAESYYDFGFSPRQIYIEVTGGDIDVKFLHQVINAKGLFGAPEAPSNSVRKSTDLQDGDSRIYRERNQRYVAIKGTGTFRLEAW